MRARRVLVALALVVAVGGLTACDEQRVAKQPKPPKAFCAAATKYDNRIQTLSVAEQLQLVEQMAATAPPEIKADAIVFRDAMRKVAAGDRSLVGDRDVQAAVERVNRRAAQGCGFFARKGGI